MASDVPGFALTAFVTLFVTIGPIETAAVYAMLTSGVHRPERARLAWRSVVIAGGLLVAFAFAGNPVLGWLHVSAPAFRFAAGAMLFLQAVSLVFSSPTGMSSLSAAEEREAMKPGDIAVFPLAFPLIAGPGSLTAIVVLMGEAGPVRAAIVMAALLVCLGLTYLALIGAERLGRILGVTGADVVGRVSGILLAALAAQFMFDGLREARLFEP
jgi:multiple antibiotic resistance protein